VNRPEGDATVELECDEVFLVGPVLPISFNWNRKTGLPTLALRTFAFKSIRAVTAVNIQTVATFQNPNPRVVISAALIGCPEELLTISVDVAGPFHATRFKRKACELGRGKSRDQRPETRDQRPEVRGRRTEDGGRRTEDGGRRTEDGGRRTEDGGRRTEDGGRRTEDGGRRSEVRGRRSEVGGQRRC
jgi:ATP-dependent RNA helicase DHX57